MFNLISSYKPAGDQIEAIDKLACGLENNQKSQVLLGVTGSGKTFTIANVIEATQRPALVMTHNKTLAAQLFTELKGFFPNNAVEYFVSYYDYYQPEAYVPSSDSYIEKDAAVNAHIEQMRLSATRALLERNDAIVVASVSAIYGLGDPGSLLEMVLTLNKGDKFEQRSLLKIFGELQYRRNQTEIYRGEFRVHGENIEIFPADSEKHAIRLQFFDDELEEIQCFDPLTGEPKVELDSIKIHPTSHYVTNSQRIERAVESIQTEFKQRYQELMQLNKLVEAQRLEQKIKLDLEMLNELGYCNGIENYSRHFTGLPEGEPPPTLMDYLPKNCLMVIDESHVAVPQFRAMYRGDRSRKQTLVEYGFRLPSALDNRPLQFHEFEKKMPQCIFVSATPAEYELHLAGTNVVEQVVRPTGLLDPQIEVKPAKTQVDDVLVQINKTLANNQRVLITTLTKRMSENLAEFLDEAGIKVRYLHSDIDTVERVNIIRDLRLGVVDVLVGINLLREGLDIPEVSLVAILDADKEGFLRSEVSLIQTIGRAARHKDGRVILYADKITESMQKAIDETARRREKQEKFNLQNGITPVSINKPIFDGLDEENEKLEDEVVCENTVLSPTMFAKMIKKMEKQMKQYALDLDFENAAKVRDEIALVRKNYFSNS